MDEENDQLVISIISSSSDENLREAIVDEIETDEFDEDLKNNIEKFNTANDSEYDVVIYLGDSESSQVGIQLWQVIVAIVALIIIVVVITVIIVCYCQKRKDAEKDTTVIDIDEGEDDAVIPPGHNQDISHQNGNGNNNKNNIEMINKPFSDDRRETVEGPMPNVNDVYIEQTQSELLYTDIDNGGIKHHKETAGNETKTGINDSSSDSDSMDIMYDPKHTSTSKGTINTNTPKNNHVHLPDSSADLGAADV